MAKKIVFYGKSEEEVKGMSMQEFTQFVSSRVRRKMKRGFTDEEKKLLEKVRKNKRNIETHCRDMIIVPEMLGQTIKVHTGKTFESVTIELEMLGHRLGEFALSRKRVAHSSPGVGATRSSAASSVK